MASAHSLKRLIGALVLAELGSDIFSNASDDIQSLTVRLEDIFL